MKSKIKILNYYEDRVPKKLLSLVKKKFNHKNIIFKRIKYTEALSKQISFVKWANFLLLTPGRVIHDEVLKNSKHIKLIQIWSSGYDKLNLNEIFKNRIPIANNGSVNATSVAEHTVMLMLAVYRKLLAYGEIAKKGKWKGNLHGIDCYNLNNKKIGIIGLGNIGTKVANICKSFGSKIFYYDIKKYKNSKFQFLSLKRLVASCDIITLHLHSNKQTFKILNKKLLSRMKKGSIIVNVSRSDLIDYSYLNNMLKKKKIFGAGLDVYDKEPTLPGDMFLDLDNVVLTPHTAGSSIDTYMEVINNCYNNIISASKNKNIKWLIKR